MFSRVIVNTANHINVSSNSVTVSLNILLTANNLYLK